MILQKISEEDLEFCEDFYDPIAFSETMFSNFDDWTSFEEDKFSEVRDYQLPMLSFEFTIDYENLEGYTKKELFQLRKGLGDLFNFGGRNTGKTKISEELDVLLRIAYSESGEHIGFSSYDFTHICGVLDKLKDGVEHHPFFEKLDPQVKTQPPYIIYFNKNKVKVEGINMNLNSKKPGARFFQKHLPVLYLEEASFESEDVYEKRKEAVSELGCVLRVAGMSNFTKHSPAGKMFCASENIHKTMTVPRYISPSWDEAEKKNRIEEYGGLNSAGFRVFIKGEIVEDGVSVFDMQRVRACYPEDGKDYIINYEINKQNFERFKNILILERPKNANRVYLAADIGDGSGGSELILLSEILNNNQEPFYKYLYNITLFNLTDDEQKEIIQWLIGELRLDVVAVDAGDGCGRAIYNALEKFYPKENLVWYRGNEKVSIDFERDLEGNILLKNGQPICKEEFMAEWAIKVLQKLFYSKNIYIPKDAKFDKQINSVVAEIRENRTIYHCMSNKDHMLDAWKVFAIAKWQKEFSKTGSLNDDWGIGTN